MPNTVVSLVRSSHPGPTLAVTIVAGLLGVGLGLGPGRIAILCVAFLLNQASVGLSNDWLDAERDRAAGRTDKPVALGLLSVRLVRGCAIATAILALLVMLPLGPLATGAQAVFVASAWAYNAWLKNSVCSVLPYIVSFGLLPMIVALCRPTPALAAAWALGLGALLGVAAHFANVLPDLDDDLRTGIRGLPHRLGRTLSGVVIWVALALGAVLAFAGPAEEPTPIQWAALVGTLSLAAAIAVLARRPPTRLLFQLIIAAALINVVALAVSGTRLLA